MSKKQKVMSDSVSVSDFYEPFATLKQLFNLFFLCCVVALFIWLSIVMYQWKNDPVKFPLTQLVVQSKQNSKVTVSEIQQTLNKMKLKGFFSQNVNEVKQAVERLPWVQSALVRKQWPDTLIISVHEYQAMTKWNQTELLSADGSIFSANAENLDDKVLIDLQGPDDSSKLVLSTYRKLQDRLKGLDLTIVSLILNDRHSWKMQLQDGLELRLGRNNIDERMGRFIKLYPMLHQQTGHEQQLEEQQVKKIAYVDLRYDSGVAVGWQERTPESATNLLTTKLSHE